MKIRWYTGADRENGGIYWWTQRDKNGNCFEIRKLPLSKRFRLLVNENTKISDHDTLSKAQRIAEEEWVE